MTEPARSSSSWSPFASLVVAAALGLGTLFLQTGGELQKLKGMLRPARNPASRQALTQGGTPGLSEDEMKARTEKWASFEAGSGRKIPAFLIRYEALDKKALKSNEELRELHRMLSNRADLHHARDYLSGIEQDISLHQTIKRIEVVDFLIEAERWSGNPNREAAVEAMRNFIEERQDLATLTEQSRRALFGDKVELYDALCAADPSVAESIKGEATDASLASVIDFAETHLHSGGLRVPSKLADSPPGVRPST